jgi:hypothetical protein
LEKIRDNSGEILTLGRWESMTNVKYENRCIGQHFFSPSAMRWFNSRIGSTIYGGRFFITSEQDSYGAWGGKRRYTIRVIRDNADIVFRVLSMRNLYRQNRRTATPRETARDQPTITGATLKTLTPFLAGGGSFMAGAGAI